MLLQILEQMEIILMDIYGELGHLNITLVKSIINLLKVGHKELNFGENC